MVSKPNYDEVLLDTLRRFGVTTREQAYRAALVSGHLIRDADDELRLENTIRLALEANNNLVPSAPGHLTAGDLRRRLEGICDLMPVFYEILPDHLFTQRGWKCTRLRGDQFQNLTPQMYETLGEEDRKDFILDESTGMYVYMVPAMQAFTAYRPTLDGQGREAIMLTAHY